MFVNFENNDELDLLALNVLGVLLQEVLGAR